MVICNPPSLFFLAEASDFVPIDGIGTTPDKWAEKPATADKEDI